MNGTLEVLPPLDDLPPLDGAVDSALFGDAIFEDLLAQAANNPDDTEVAAKLTAQVREVLDSGEVDRALEMAMVLGATACSHPHLEDLANELGEEVLGYAQDRSGNDHAAHERNAQNDSKKDKRRRAAGISLAELLAKYPLFSKSSGQK